MSSTGPSLLRSFLADHELTQRDAATALGVSDPTLHDWLTEAKRPRVEHRSAIAIWTRGAVPASSWATDDEREVVDRVQPFVPAAKGAA